MKKIKVSKEKPKNVIRKIVLGLVMFFFLSILGAFIFELPEIFMFSCFIIFLLSFITIAIKMLMNKVNFLKSSNTFSKSILNHSETEFETPNRNFLANPRNFHILMIILILLNLVLSHYNIGTYNNSFYDHFYNDLVFQFNIAILFTIIGFLNPLLGIPYLIRNRIKERNGRLYDFISNDKKLFYSRLLACVLVILLFIYKGWLVFPNLLQENILLMGIDLALLLFVVTTVYRMFKYAKIFLIENLFRVVKSFTIFTSSIFVLVPLVPLTMLILHLCDIDERTFNFQPIPFIGFNIIMAYVEHSLNVQKSSIKKAID